MYNICALSKKSLVTYAEFLREEFDKTSRGKLNNIARKNTHVCPKCGRNIFLIVLNKQYCCSLL